MCIIKPGNDYPDNKKTQNKEGETKRNPYRRFQNIQWHIDLYR